jgi:two-component system heavy metal sensor histidine kinase CusS
MSSKNYEAAAGAVRERRVFAHFSIGARLAICYTLSAFGMLAAVTTAQYGILIRGMEWDEAQIVLDKIKMFEATLRVHGDNQAFLDHEVNLKGGAYWPEQHYIVYSRILDEAGRVIIETPDMEHLIPETEFPLPVVPRQARDLKVVSYREAPNGHSYFLMSAWARSGGEDGPRRLIQVAMDETGERVMIASYRRDTLLVLFLGTLLFAVVGTFIAHRCLRPVHDLARTLERIKPNDVISRINPDTSRWPKELTTLADSFYSLLFRIETSFNRCSQCAEDLAHEVRNPIHSLMGEAEVALSKDRTPDEYRQVLESSLEEYTRLSQMINELLFIARADNPCTAIERARFDVHGELDAVREFHDAQAQEQGITITCAGRASVDADPLLFRRAVSNLVSNALFHTSEGGEISLTVRKADRDSMVEIAIRDTGCGINAEDLPRIFDRFYRIERKKLHQNEGAGLGLAIVKSIMTLHGGSVFIESTEGKGTTIVLQFPSPLHRVEGSTSTISGFVSPESA